MRALSGLNPGADTAGEANAWVAGWHVLSHLEP